VSVPISRSRGAVTAAVRRLDAAGIEIDDISTERPTLDDVFLELTGQTATGVEEEQR
jgi:ABC-2 type transport system ATP-binding protein